MTPKDKKIIEQCEKTGEPIFVFRAKDRFAPKVLQFYMAMALDEGCSMDFAESMSERIVDFEVWQDDNEDKVKIPD